MVSDTVSSTGDALRLVGGILLLVRTVEQQLRSLSGVDALSNAELGVLAYIQRGVDLPSQIARVLRLDPGRITHLTDRLANQQLIERSVDAQDRRCWRLSITPLGIERLVRGREDLTAVTQTLLASLTPEEQAGLQLGLEGVRRALDALPDRG